MHVDHYGGRGLNGILKLATAAALAAGCSESQASTAPGGGGSSADGPPAGRCAVEERAGNFEVAIETTFSAVSGQVADRAALAAELREIGSEGTCRLIRR